MAIRKGAVVGAIVVGAALGISGTTNASTGENCDTASSWTSSGSECADYKFSSKDEDYGKGHDKGHDDDHGKGGDDHGKGGDDHGKGHDDDHGKGATTTTARVATRATTRTVARATTRNTSTTTSTSTSTTTSTSTSTTTSTRCTRSRTVVSRPVTARWQLCSETTHHA